MIINTNSETETRELGRKFARALRPNLTVLLYGDLGSGKTVFVRGICEELGIKNARSPSFTLVNEYKSKNFMIAHADLYRLDVNNQDEIDALGLDDYINSNNAVLIVEWPERWLSQPKNVIKIYFTALDENKRALKFESDLDLNKLLLLEA